MKDKKKNMEPKSENIRKELAHLSRLFKARKAALDKMSKSILEDEAFDKDQKTPINKPKT